jgi:FtsZ-interacting cell division protein ZipA
MFQIAHTTIFPNYPGEELKTLDCEVLVVSVDRPSQDGETDAQRKERENANADMAARWQQELAAAAPVTGQHAANAGQGNDNIGEQAPIAPANHQHHEGHPSHLRARDLLRNFEHDGLEVYNSPQTNPVAALAALNQFEDTPMIRRLQANVHFATAQIEERGPGYSRSAASSYFRSRSKRPRQQRRNNGSLEPVAEEGRGENEVMQPTNPAANAAANAPANAATNTAGNVVNNAANAANIQTGVAANPRQNAGAQPPPVQANHAEGS